MRILVNVLAAIGILTLGFVGILWFSAKDATRSDPACSTSDIKIDKVNGRVDGDWIYVAGRLINNCDKPIGVQIKVTIYDKNGNILTVHDSWPASIKNIPAHTDFPFEDMIQRVRGFDKFEIRVIEVKNWRQ